MEERNWNQDDLAAVLGVTPKTMSKIINNKQGITPDTAKLLGKSFGQSMEFWLNLYNNYQLRIKQKRV